ncbi:MAG: YdeI/OmpD-associated family protein [Gemmatimonadota bacterium]|nr:YdeI/OmpD-associated family protein [Gemmatimonadota bacterium]
MPFHADSHPARVARWRDALPSDLVEGLAARPGAAETFDRMSLFEIRSVVRWVQTADSDRERGRRLKRVFAGLDGPPHRRRGPAA